MKRIDGWIRSMATMAFALLVIVGLAACERQPEGPAPGEEVLAEMEPGYGKQAVLNSLPEGPDVDGAANMQKGYRVDRYFVEGRSVEVLWVRPHSDESLTELGRERTTPVIFVDETLDGWGWDHFEVRQEDWGIMDRTASAPEDPNNG